MILPLLMCVCVCEIKCHPAVQHKWTYFFTDVQFELCRLKLSHHINQLKDIMRVQFKSTEGSEAGLYALNKWCTLCHLVLFTVQRSVCVRAFVYALVKSRCYERPRQSWVRIRDLFCVCESVFLTHQAVDLHNLLFKWHFIVESFH